MTSKRKPGPDSDERQPDKLRTPGPDNELEIDGCIGDAVAFVSNGQDIRIRISAAPYQMAQLTKLLLTETAAKAGKVQKFQQLIDAIDEMFLDADFRVRAHLWLSRKDLNVGLPAESGEIVPAGWAAPKEEE